MIRDSLSFCFAFNENYNYFFDLHCFEDKISQALIKSMKWCKNKSFNHLLSSRWEILWIFSCSFAYFMEHRVRKRGDLCWRGSNWSIFIADADANADKRIVIIGAGSSGVAAATKLIENGFKNIKILEAEGRMGGRIYTVPFGDNVAEMGAHM